MSLSMMLYTEIDVVCIILLMFISFRSHNSVLWRQSWRFYRRALLSFLTLNILDLVWLWCEAHVFPLPHAVIYIVYGLYYVFTTVSTVLWLYYVEDEMDTGLVKNRLFLFITNGITIVMLVLVAASYFTGSIFTLDESLDYHRGPLVWLPFTLPIVFFSFACLHAAVRALDKRLYIYRRTSTVLMFVSLFIALAYVMQLLLPGTPIQCMGTTAAMLAVFMDAQEQLVTADPLTGLHNRLQMERYLISKLDGQARDSLLLMLIDVDRFKQINDTYGHVEGDRALVRLAEVLKRAELAYHCFTSRYGGDEFIVVHELAHEGEYAQLRGFILSELAEINKSANCPYDLRVSIGCARCGEDIRYVPDFIASADRALYEAKGKLRAERTGKAV